MAVFSANTEATSAIISTSLAENTKLSGETGLTPEQQSNLSYLKELNTKNPGSLIRITEDEDSDVTVMLCSNEDVFNPVSNIVVADENGVFLLSAAGPLASEGLNMSSLAFNPNEFKQLMSECSQGKEQLKSATIDGVDVIISWVDPAKPSEAKERVEALLDKISNS